MKPRFTFQTLILITLAPVVALLTAFWTWEVYRSTHRIILAGFDHKLLALAGGAAAFIDGDAHELYQRPRSVIALASTPRGLVGFDQNSAALLAIDTNTGSAQPLRLPATAIQLRSLAKSPEPSGFFGLSQDGMLLLEFDGAEGRVRQTIQLPSPLDGIALFGGALTGWRGTRLFQIDVGASALVPLPAQLPEPLQAMASEDEATTWIGLSADGSSLLVLDAQARLVRRVALHTLADPPSPAPNTAPSPPALERLPPPLLRAIAFQGRQLLGAGDGLVTIDPQSGVVSRGDLIKGYFDLSAPFYQIHRKAFVELQQTSGLSYLYTQVYTGEKHIYYVLDGTLGGNYTRPGTSDELPDSTVEAAEQVQFIGHPWISPIQSWQTWGLVKSCFTSVRDSHNRVVAMAGADVDIGVITKKTRWAAFAAIMIGAISMVAAGGVSFRVARSLTRPLQKLKEATLWIAAGYYGAKIEVGGTREVAALAVALDRLRERLEGDGKLVRGWQEEIREERQRTALSQALAETLAQLGGNRIPGGGSCQRATDVVWWYAPTQPEALAGDCARTRNTTLALELLAAGSFHAAIPARMLAAEPDLEAVASWEEKTGTLYYATRRDVGLRTATADRRLSGTGQLQFAVCPAVGWVTPPPANPNETGGPLP